jgi:hypothetical protein
MKDRIDKELRSAAPRAERDFVATLASEIPAPRPRRSRTAFASAVAVIVLGFAMFGGVGYAAEGAQNVAGAAKKAVTKTSATDQYANTNPVQPAETTETTEPPTVQVAGATEQAPKSTLPFTGLSLLGTVGIGLALVAVGFALRRRERESDS